MEYGFWVLSHWNQTAETFVSVKEDIKIMNFVLDVVHIKVIKLETVPEHAKTD